MMINPAVYLISQEEVYQISFTMFLPLLGLKIVCVLPWPPFFHTSVVIMHFDDSSKQNHTMNYLLSDIPGRMNVSKLLLPNSGGDCDVVITNVSGPLYCFLIN